MSDQNSTVTLELLGQLMRDMQSDMLDVKTELRDHRSLLLALAEQGRRTDRHVTELRDDLELMIKMEVMGRLGQFETTVGHRLDALEGRAGAAEAEAHPS